MRTRIMNRRVRGSQCRQRFSYQFLMAQVGQKSSFTPGTVSPCMAQDFRPQLSNTVAGECRAIYTWQLGTRSRELRTLCVILVRDENRRPLRDLVNQVLILL